MALIAVFAVGCAVSSRVALPPLPAADVFILLVRALTAGASGQAYGPEVLSTNLTTSGTGTLSACGFASPSGTTAGNNVVPSGLQISVGTPPGGAAGTGCVISGTIAATVTPGTYTFTVRAADSSSPPQTDDEVYTIVVSSLVITLGGAPATTVTGETFSVTWSFTVVGSAAVPNQNVLVELVNAANAVEDSCTAAIGALGCGGLASPAVGMKTIRLTYPAPPATDPNFPAGAGASRGHTVNAAGTTTTITADAPDPSVTGQAYTVNVTVAPVAPGAGAPTGSVNVNDGVGNVCVAPLTPGANQSTGSCMLTSPTAGAFTLIADYPGDANYGLSSDNEAHQVNAAPTTTTITADAPDPSVIGEAYTVSVTVDVNAPGAGTPTGIVTIQDGQGVSCMATLAIGPGANQSSGSCIITSLTTAVNTLTAIYAGDANFQASVGNALHTVNPAATTTTITADTPDPSVTGQSYTVSVTVDTVAPGMGQPTGNVTVNDGQGQNCLVALVGGPGANQSSGSCLITSNSTAVTTLTANYPGAANFAASSDTEAHTVTLAPTTTTITNVAPSPSAVGQAYTVDVVVAPVAPGTGAPTGSVNITDGGFGGSCVVTLVPGVNQSTGSCMATSTATAMTTLAANYGGDLNFAPSIGLTAHTITAAATTTTITSDNPDPSVVGQAITVNVTVAPATTGAPTGSVSVGDGFGGSCLIAALTPGMNQSTGSCLLTPTTTSVTTLTANYGGDANFGGSVGMAAHVVNPALTTTTITNDSPDPSQVFQGYQVDVTVAPVAPGAGAPVGNVTITDGFSPPCMIPLIPGAGISTGSNICVSNSTAVTTLTATYSGDANFAPSMDTEPHIVTPITTTTTITSDINDPSVIGEQFSVIVQVVGTIAGGPPTGMITVNDGIGGMCSNTLVGIALDTSAMACNLTPAPAMTPVTLTLTANYPGDGAIYAASADTDSHDVVRGSTTTALMSSANPSVSGETVTFTATVAPVAPATGTPTGSVQFQINGVNAGAPVALVGGVAALMQVFTAAVSPETIDAIYSGDGNFNGSAAATLTQIINPANSVTTLVSSVNPSVSNENVTFTATVAAVVPGTGTPTGSVQFFLNGGPLGAPVALVGGVAMSATVPFTVANSPENIDATYAGDTEFLGSPSNTVVQVTNPANVVVGVTPPGAATVTGETYTVNVTVGAQAPGGGTPTGAVNVDDGTGGTCTIAALAGGMGNCMITSTSAGVKIITANYIGPDAEFNAGSGTQNHTVNAAPTTVIVTQDSVDPSPTGDLYPIDVQVDTQAPGTGAPTGMVTITDTLSVTFCNATLVASGPNTSTGTCSLFSRVLGVTTGANGGREFQLDVNFTGNTDFAPSTDNNEMHEAIKGGVGIPTITTVSNIAMTAGSSIVGEPYTVDAAVNASSGTGTPGGLVNVDDSEGNTCSFDPAVATSCVLTTFSSGTKTINASYAGDGEFNGNSNNALHDVNASATTTTITMDAPDPSGPGAMFNVTAVVSSVSPGGGEPTGIVNITDGLPVSSCMAILVPGPMGSNMSTGSCMLTGPAVPAGLNLTADYTGDGNYLASSDPDGEPHTVAVVMINPIVLGDGTELRTIGTGTSGLAGVRFPITGGIAPYACTDPGATLPAGVTVTLAVTGTDCELQGTPAAASAATYMVDITVTDSTLPVAGTDTTGPITWIINQPLIITSGAAPGDAVDGSNYGAGGSAMQTAMGGAGMLTWDDNSGTLAADVDCASFSISVAGDITATPATRQMGGDDVCDFTERVQDMSTSTTASGMATQAMTIPIQPTLAIATVVLPNAKRANTYMPLSVGGFPGAVVNATGGTGTPYTYDVTGGDFTCAAGTCSGIAATPCEGLSFAQTGVDAGSGNTIDTVIVGVPVNAGVCSVDLRVMDLGSGPTAPGIATQTLTITVLGSFGYVTGSANNTLQVFDSSTNTFTTSIALAGSPDQAAITRDGRFVVVTLPASDQVEVIDVTTNARVMGSPFAVGPTCDEPRGVATNDLPGIKPRAYVVCTNNDTAIGIDLDPADLGTGAFAAINDSYVDISNGDPLRIAFTPNGQRFYASVDLDSATADTDSEFAVIDVVDAGGGAPGAIAGSPFAFATGGANSCEDVIGVAIAQTNRVGNPIEAYFACSGASAEVVLVFNTATNTVTVANTAGVGVNSVAFIPGNPSVRAHFTNTGDNELEAVDTDDGTTDNPVSTGAGSVPLGVVVEESAPAPVTGFRVYVAFNGVFPAATNSNKLGVFNDANPPTVGAGNPITLQAATNVAPRAVVVVIIPRPATP